MRTLIILLIFFSIAEFTFAQKDTLTFNMVDGQSHSVAISSIKKITLGERTSVKDQREINKIIADIKNFPNPANKSTQFSFELIETGNVQIKIYNIQGIEINTIDVKDCKQGANIVSWDCKDANNKQVENGVYIYEVIFKDIHITKNMIILD